MPDTYVPTQNNSTGLSAHLLLSFKPDYLHSERYKALSESKTATSSDSVLMLAGALKSLNNN